MRKSVLLWLALAAFCGVALFHTGQKVHDAREKLSRLEQATAKEEESIRVLQAEWGYLNQPGRLEKLAKTYLKLAPMKGSQFAKLESIPMRGEKTEAVAPAPEKAEIAVKAPPIVLQPPAQTPAQRPVAATDTAKPRKIADVIKNLSAE